MSIVLRVCFWGRNACAKRRYHFVFFAKWVSVRADRNFDGASDFRGTGYQSQTNAGAFYYELVLTCLLEHRNLAYTSPLQYYSNKIFMKL